MQTRSWFSLLNALCRTASFTISNVTVSALVILLTSTAEAKASPFQFATVFLTNRQPTIKIELAWRPGIVAKHPAILMLGTARSNSLPSWSSNLLNEGYILVAFNAERGAHLTPIPRAARNGFTSTNGSPTATSKAALTQSKTPVASLTTF